MLQSLRISELLDALADEGFGVSIESRLRVLRLLLEVATAGGEPVTAQTLADDLAALFVRPGKSRAAFDRIFAQYGPHDILLRRHNIAEPVVDAERAIPRAGAGASQGNGGGGFEAGRKTGLSTFADSLRSGISRFLSGLRAVPRTPALAVAATFAAVLVVAAIAVRIERKDAGGSGHDVKNAQSGLAKSPVVAPAFLDPQRALPAGGHDAGPSRRPTLSEAASLLFDSARFFSYAPTLRELSLSTSKLEAPYQVAGKWYYPREQPNYDETGIASAYGPDFIGHRTADGETYDPTRLTAAHATIPLPSYVRVSNMDNGRSTVVRVNDRRPFVNQELVGLSAAAAKVLGFDSRTTAHVRVTYLKPFDAPPAAVSRRLGLAADRPLPMTDRGVLSDLLWAVTGGSSGASNASPQSSEIESASNAVQRQVWTALQSEPSARSTEIVSPRFTVVKTLPGDVKGAFIARKPNSTAIAWFGDGTLIAFDLGSGASWTRKAVFRRSVEAGTISPAGDRILTLEQDGLLQTLDGANGRPAAKPIDLKASVDCAAFAPDAAEVALISRGGGLRIVNAATGVTIARAAIAPASAGCAVAFSPDAQRVAAVSGGTGVVFGIKTLENVPLTGAQGVFTGVTFSPDGQRVATAAANGSVDIWNAATNILHFDFPHSGIRSVAYDPDGTRLLAYGSGEVRLFDLASGSVTLRSQEPGAVILAVTQSNDGSEFATISNKGVVREGEAAEPLAPVLSSMRDAPWTARRFSDWITQRARALDIERPPPDNDTTIARMAAARAFMLGQAFDLSGTDWNSNRPQPIMFDILGRNLAVLIFSIGLTVALLMWVVVAVRQRAFLEKSRTRDPSLVIDLFLRKNREAKRTDADIRKAATQLLAPSQGGSRFDLIGSVVASARAGGLLTWVNTQEARASEYLFLIDSQSRQDHVTHRVVDMLARLAQETASVARYFFERAPQRVRADIGEPSLPLDVACAHHAHKRLVLVAEAQNLLEPDTARLGGWQASLGLWPQRVLLTAKPASLWGRAESIVVDKADMPIDVLSVKNLARLPLLFDREPGKQVPIALLVDEQPAPALLLRDTERWSGERAPSAEELTQLDRALFEFLGYHGLRWLRACAVYPIVQWDLTWALGEVLLDHSGRPLNTEIRLAALSELPWMRNGDMPLWLRLRLISAIDEPDRLVIHQRIAQLLSEVARVARPGDTSNKLKFGLGRGTASTYSDEPFVRFVAYPPEGAGPEALEATKHLRTLLRTSLLVRLWQPSVLAWFSVGVIWALTAYWIAPQATQNLSSIGTWISLVSLAGVPLLLLYIQWAGARVGKRARDFLRSRREGRSRRRVGSAIYVYFLTWLGFATRAARHVAVHGSPPPARMLRSRVRFWVATALLPWALAMLLLVVVLAAALAKFLDKDFESTQSFINGLIESISNPILLAVVEAAAIAAIVALLGFLIVSFARVLAWSGERVADRMAGASSEFLAHGPGHALRGLVGSAGVFVLIAIMAVGGKRYLDDHPAVKDGLVWGSILLPAIFAVWHGRRMKRFRVVWQRMALNLPVSVKRPDILLRGSPRAVARARKAFSRRGLRTAGFEKSARLPRQVAYSCSLVECGGSRYSIRWPDGRWIDGPALRARGADATDVADAAAAQVLSLEDLRHDFQPVQFRAIADAGRGTPVKATFSADGHHVAAAFGDGTVCVWNSNDLSLAHTLAHASAVNCIAVSGPNNLILAACEDGSATIWNVVTGKPVARFSGHGGPIVWCAFSDEVTAVTCARDRTLCFWDARIGRESLHLSLSHEPRCGTLAPDGRSFLNVAESGYVQVCEAATGASLFDIHARSQVSAAAYAPDSAILATGGADGTISVWNLALRREASAFSRRNEPIVHIAFSPDGRRLLAVSRDGVVDFWDIEVGISIASLGSRGLNFRSAEFSPDGKQVVTSSADGRLRIWVEDKNAASRFSSWTLHIDVDRIRDWARALRSAVLSMAKGGRRGSS